MSSKRIPLTRTYATFFLRTGVCAGLFEPPRVRPCSRRARTRAHERLSR